MRKSTVFISVVLTTFVLVLLYNVALAQRQNSQATEALTQPTATLARDRTSMPTASAVEVSMISPEEAAQLAGQVVGNSNLLSAESSAFHGADAYKITFTNNDVVYIGLEGQILSVQVAPVTVNAAVPVQHTNHKKSGNNHGAPQSHESDEDHQEHED
jgi:hypothetical protein